MKPLLEEKRNDAAIVCVEFLRRPSSDGDEATRWAAVSASERNKVEPVLDWLEDIGFYLAGDQFSDHVVHHNFFHWIRGWYSVLRPYIDYYQTKEKSAYVHVESLYGRTAEIERRYPGANLILATSESRLEFLCEEGGEGDLKVSAQLSFNSGPPTFVRLGIGAVNLGPTPVTVSSVAIVLSKTSVPIPPGTSDEVAAQMRMLCVASELLPSDKQPVELTPYGGQHSWEIHLLKNPGFELHQKNGDSLGTGYITLTSGRRIFFEFFIPDDSAWQKISETSGPAPHRQKV